MMYRAIIAILLLISLYPAVYAESRTGDYATWTQRGDDLYLQGRYGEAVDAYNKALEMDPYYSLAWNKRGIALVQLGYYEEAIRNFNRAIELDPFYGQAWDNKGDVMLQTGQYNESMSAYERAIAINPNDLHALSGKGANLQKLGRNEEARGAFEEVVRIADRNIRRNPNDAKYDANLWSDKGDALFRLGQLPEALIAYNHSLEINPKNPDVTRNRDLVIGMINVGEGNTSPATGDPVILPTTTPTRAGSYLLIPLLGLTLAAGIVLFSRKPPS